MTSSMPFALPEKLEADLAEVRAHWHGLIRGQASDMPFWDDVKLSALPKIEDRLMLVGVFEKPERFRFDILGKHIVKIYGADVTGKFADEIEPGDPFEYFRSQAGVTVEGAAPTYYKSGTHARLLLPLWGDGRISMLLGAVAKS